MLVQPINNYQNNYYNNSFKAQIIKTEYLLKGLEHAKHKSLDVQADVINMLEHIKHDRNINIFRIFRNFNGNKGKNDISVIQADDKQYTNQHDELGFVSFAKDKDGKWILTKGGLCIAAIKDFMKKNYGEATVNRLIHRGEKQYGFDKMKQLDSQIKYAKNTQDAQKYKQKLELMEQNVQKELTERYNRFEASLTDLNKVMN